MAQNVIINGVTYQDVPEVDIPKQGGGTAKFFDAQGAQAAVGDVLATKTFFKDGGLATGEMPNNGDTSGTISTKAGTVTIPAGYTQGGTAQISQTEQAKIITDNIKSGVTILGVQGKQSVVDTTIPQGAASAGEIVNGYKAYVNGSLIEGNATMPTVSQDSTTKVLTIQ